MPAGRRIVACFRHGSCRASRRGPRYRWRCDALLPGLACGRSGLGKYCTTPSYLRPAANTLRRIVSRRAAAAGGNARGRVLQGGRPTVRLLPAISGRRNPQQAAVGFRHPRATRATPAGRIRCQGPMGLVYRFAHPPRKPPMNEDPRCCGSGTCIIDPEGRCWCGQQWDGEKMVSAPLKACAPAAASAAPRSRPEGAPQD